MTALNSNRRRQLTQEIRRCNRGHGRTGKVLHIPRDDENRRRCLGHGRHHRILEIRERELPCLRHSAASRLPI